MEAKPEILIRKTIKPSSPTPTHLKDYKLSYFDQLFDVVYIPFVLFYSASDVNSHKTSFSSMCEKLKTSLSAVLTLYYPFCGRAKGNASIECNDAGVLYTEARVPFRLTEILRHPKTNVLKQFFPFDPHDPGVEDCINEEKVMLAIQVSELNCGAVGVGVCVSHLIADVASISTFLNAWVTIAKGSDNITKPHMEASKIFPPKDTSFAFPVGGQNKEIVGKRLVFDGKSLSKLKAEMEGFNPTRVEAVTAFIWKLLIDITKASLGEKKYVGSFASQVVNFRSRLEPPLPEHSIGNLTFSAFTSAFEFQDDQRIELKDLAMLVRDAVRNFVADGDMNKLLGDGGYDVCKDNLKKGISVAIKGNKGFGFSSWNRFCVYEADFGWGKPTWACTIGLPVKDAVILMPTKSGEGIEAWVNLSEQDMVKFEQHPELLQYANVSPFKNDH